MNIQAFIEQEIKKAFDALTEKLSNELAAEQGGDMPSGALVFEMMSAEIYMQIKWREYCEKKESER